jgi:ferredoxin
VHRLKQRARVSDTAPVATMSGGTKLRVDPIACDGRGLCAEVAPELITLDDWGFPIIKAGSVPADREQQAREAARLCPKLALRLERCA